MNAEFFGTIALITCIAAYFFKDDIKFKSLQLVCCVFFAIHYLMLEAYSGAISVGLGIFSLGFALTIKNKTIDYTFVAIYIVLLIFGLYNFKLETWHEILPYVSNIFWVVGMILLSGQKTNIFLIAVVACWAIYAIEISSISSFWTQIFVLFFIFYRMFIMHLEKQKQNKLSTEAI